jgi:hypothetical protein
MGSLQKITVNLENGNKMFKENLKSKFKIYIEFT